MLLCSLKRTTRVRVSPPYRSSVASGSLQNKAQVTSREQTMRVFAARLFRRGLLHRAPVALAIAFFFFAYAKAAYADLPLRSPPPIETTPGVPHVQINVEAVPVLQTELLRRVSELPGLEIRPTVIGMFGAKGFWLLEDLTLVRPEVIFRGREFAHLHTDGSLHASLPQVRAFEAVAAGWAVRHPSAQYHARLEGFVMLYTPRTMDELEVVFQLIVDGYNFILGSNVLAQDFRLQPQ